MLERWQHFFCQYDFFIFKDKQQRECYNTWRKPSRLKQISQITFLTAFLYFIFAFLDIFIAPPPTKELMIITHLFILPLLLFTISYMAYLNKSCLLMTSLLMAAPIVANIFNLYIASFFPSYTIYITEIYLSIFWIFTVSGLRLVHATYTAFIVFILSSIIAYKIYPHHTNEFIMHLFWMTAVSTFGFFSGYILEDSNRKIFLKQEALEHQASTDQLTGIYNRFKLDEILQQEIDKYYRYGRTFCIMILDIDHFKNVNDTYGHQIGDYTLVEIAKTLQNSIRSSDTLVRWGGEEFLLLCLEIDKERALKMAENIRLKIESTKIQHVGTKTVSIGVTANHTNDTINTLTKRADTALYKAKTSGRNRVEFA